MLRNAHETLRDQWSFLKDEADVDSAFNDRAAQLEDLLHRETFYQKVAGIDQHAAALRDEYRRRHREASTKRVEVYTAAIEKMKGVPIWGQLNEDQQKNLIAPLESCVKAVDESANIPLLRADIDACSGRLQKAIEEMMRLIDGNRVVRLDVGKFFSGGIETEEQLNAAIDALREECERQLGEGKKILIQ